MKSWIPDAIIYQVNLRAFAFREPRNPVEAAREKPPRETPLAYLTRHVHILRRLGANVLYLMPIYPMGVAHRKGIGSPYAIRDFRDVDPEYGSREDLAALVRRAHALGLKVILDITPNHTSRDHCWMRTHPEYYVRTPGGEIYHDADWSDTAKLDYRQPALRREMLEVYDFWLSFLGPGETGFADGVDGFRLDMAHFINDPSFWNEALPTLRARHPDRELLFLAESYGAKANRDLFTRGVNAAYDDDFYKFWVHFYAVTERDESVISPVTEALTSDFATCYDTYRAAGLAGAMQSLLSQYESCSPPSGSTGPFLARYTDNHDEGRGLYRFGAGAVRAAQQLIFLSPRCLPFLLAGQEYGALNRPPIHERIAPCDKGRRLLRPTGVTDRPGVEFEGNLFTRGYDDRRAWYEFFQSLIRLRRRCPALVHGEYRPLDVREEGPPQSRVVVAFARRWQRTEARCAVNLGSEPRRLGAHAALEGRPVWGRLDGDTLPPFSGVVTLRPVS